MRLQSPLFPGYVFVRIELHRRLDVIQVPGVVRLVGFNGQPTALHEEEIETLQNSISFGVCALPHSYLAAGRRVRIKAGPFAGLKGILLRRKGDLRVVLSIDLLQRSVAVDIDNACLESIPDESKPALQDRARYANR